MFAEKRLQTAYFLWERMSRKMLGETERHDDKNRSCFFLWIAKDKKRQIRNFICFTIILNIRNKT